MPLELDPNRIVMDFWQIAGRSTVSSLKLAGRVSPISIISLQNWSKHVQAISRESVKKCWIGKH